MKILVLGAYGLIGSEICRRLAEDGHSVVGLGRSARLARLVAVDRFVERDLASLTTAAAWEPLLGDVDAVVNCAGALQDGPRDRLDIVHHRAIVGLAEAAANTGTAITQISAVGARADASTAFMRTKAAGDAAVRAAETDWWILRPGLVVSRTVYGGTMLLRMLAAVPFVQPIALPEARIQCVGVGEVAAAVAAILKSDVPPRSEFDLVEDRAHRLRDVVAAYRDWLGFAPPWRIVTAPSAFVRAAATASDGLGLLGWRSPLRTTALRVLEEGVLGDPEPWRRQSGAPLPSLDAQLRGDSAGVQDRWHARLALLSPFLIATLALFWIASGVIGLVEIDAAAAVLQRNGWPEALALFSVAGWSFVDIALGIGLAIRRWAERAAEGMAVVCLVYLVAASVAAPELWLDPLGPLVKIIPAFGLALVVRQLLETR